MAEPGTPETACYHWSFDPRITGSVNFKNRRLTREQRSETGPSPNHSEEVVFSLPIPLERDSPVPPPEQLIADPFPGHR